MRNPHPDTTTSTEPPELIACAKCGDPTPPEDYDSRFGCLACCDVAAFAISAGWTTAEREQIPE